ncbi:glycosyltransferase, partial [Patescibacteria group bacterium]|nr:glycosyltransferase [Patescibacteria group bacterium]
MKTSVLIIAHNESKHIAGCIESLLSQTMQPDEIVLINHNSTDATGEIARKYPVTVVDYEGPEGSVYARIKGFETVQG